MATRAQLVTWLRRRLQETSPAQWTNSTLQDYVNEGYRELGDAIKAVDPEWLIYSDSHDIVANQELYKVPTNMDSIIEVWYKNASAAEYTQLDFRRRRSQNRDGAGETEVSYSMKGKYIRLHPIPSTNITKGLWLDYVPVPSLGEDSAVPDLPAGLHRAIVFSAQLLALGDTSEATDKAAVREELDRFLVRAQQFYDTNRDEDEFLTPDTDLMLYPDGFA
jgi:hypothetical protein